MTVQKDMFEEIERKQKELDEAQERADRRLKHFTEIAYHLSKLGVPTVAMIKKNPSGLPFAAIESLAISSNYLLSFDFVAEYRSNSYRTTGKQRLIAKGPNSNYNSYDYYKRKSWKQKKDGTFSYDKIAQDIYDLHCMELRAQKKVDQGKINSKLAAKTRGELGFEKSELSWEHGFKLTHRGVKISSNNSDGDMPLQFDFAIKGKCSPERAKELFSILEKAGLLKD